MTNLIPGRHILCTNDKGDIEKDDNGNFHIWDVIDNKLYVAPDYKALQEFFNIPSDGHSSISSGTLCTTPFEVPEEFVFIRECDDPMMSEKPTSSAKVSVKSQLQERTVKWKDKNATKALIKLWQDHESLFQSSLMKNAEVWRLISESLKKINTNWIFNAVQCENKFKDLRRHYMAVKDHNAQTGAERKTCKFYNEMEEIFCMKPNVKPIAIASNLKRCSSDFERVPVIKNSEDIETCESNDSGEQEIENGKEKNIKKKENKNGTTTGVLVINHSSRSTKKKKHKKNDIKKI